MQKNRSFQITSRSITPLIYVKKLKSIEFAEILCKEEFQIGLNDYELLRVLGKGSYAVVRLAMHKQTKKKVAIKSYEKISPLIKRNVSNEIKVLKHLDHPNIIKLIDIRQDTKGLHLIMEYAVGGSLDNYSKTRSLDTKESVKIMKQVLCAVNYFHSLGVVHRDLKLSNIIIDSSKRIKIIDFGFATFTNGAELKLYCGTPEFMAPEMVSQSPYNGKKVDIWALGVIFYVLITKTYPFTGRNEREIFRKITLGGLHNLSKVPSDLQILLKKLLCIDPSLRISAPEALNDPYLEYYKKL
jgi:serine/threonine protein kinase